MISKKYRSMYLLWNHDHLKFDLDRVTCLGKWLILAFFFKRMSEIVDIVFLNLYNYNEDIRYVDLSIKCVKTIV